MNRLLSAITAGALCLTLTTPALGAERGHFTDVPSNHWAYPAVEQAYADRAILGMGDGLFCPDDALTLAQFTAILVRMAYPQGVEVQRKNWSGEPWYVPEERVARAHGLLKGLGEEPGMDLPVSRYHMAVLIYNLLVAQGVTTPGPEALDQAGKQIPDLDQIPAEYQEQVQTVRSLGVIQGMDGAGNFRGDENMNRAHAAAIYQRLSALLDFDVDVLAFDPADYESVQELMDEVNRVTPIHREGYLSNGKPATGKNIADFMARLEKKFPDGSRWDDSRPYRYNSPQLGNGRGAGAFAYLISDWIFGEDAPVISSRDYEAMRVGDVLAFRNEDDVENWWVITGTDRLRYYGANGNAGGYVSWKTFGGLKPLLNNLNNCASRSSVLCRH